MKKLFIELALSHALAALLLAIALSMSSCISSSSKSNESTMMLPDPDGASQAEGAAYTADAMHFRKSMPSRPDWKPMDFYFKHCNGVDAKSYYSKTSYDCSGPN